MASAAEEEAMLMFHEWRGGVRGLVECGVSTVPPLFLKPTAPPTTPATPASVVAPTVDLSLPLPHAAALAGAAARSCGVFQVTNHGVPPGAAAAALAAVRAFTEQPFAVRSRFYHPSDAGSVAYGTVPIPRPTDTGGRRTPAAAAPPLMSWRDSLIVHLDRPADAYFHSLPAAFRDTLLEYHWWLERLGEEIAGLLAEGLGVGAGRLRPVQGSLMQCHYHPPCPEPERVVGSREHTDGSLFTVLAQDGVGGLQVRLDDGRWVDVVPPVDGALLVNIGDVLKVVSNDEYRSVEHRVAIKSAQVARVSIALFFNPAKHGESDFFGPLPELVTTEKPARYRSLTLPEMLNNRVELGHAKPWSLDRFRAALN